MAENIFPYELPESWQWVKLVGDFAECLDNFRSPINASERAKRIGNVPYYGATGQICWIDDFLTDEQLVLLGEDGAPFLDSFKNKAYIIEGKAWVNNHAHILRSYFGNAGNKFMKYYLNNFDFADYVTGTTRLKLTQSKMKEIVIPLPPIDEQKKIVERLESLFSKLDAAKEKVQTVLDGYELRRSVILHKAFTGELSKKFRTENNLSLDDWHEVTMDDIFTLKAGKNISATEISSVQTPVNQYPCFGGNGIRGFVNSYNSEGNFPIIGRQGALCGNINMATGKFYRESAVKAPCFSCGDETPQFL